MMPSKLSPSTDYVQGDVVLVRFVFSDETGAKRRPVVILSTDEYHRGRQPVQDVVRHGIGSGHRIRGIRPG